MAVSQSVSISLVSQDIANNSSVVNIKWTSTQSGASWNGNSRTAWYYVSLNGAGEETYTTSYTLPSNTTKTIVDSNITVYHRNDGSGSISFRTWMDTGISAGVVQKSTSYTLPTIPRESSFGSISGNTLGSPITVNISRASSSHTHKFWYRFASSADNGWSQEYSNVGSSVTFTPPLSLASRVPNSTSGTMELWLDTYSGGSKIGSQVLKNITVYVPNSVKPTISNLGLSQGTSDIQTKIGAFVQSKSTVKADIHASGTYGATIKSYLVVFEGVSYWGQNITTRPISGSGQIAIKASVLDSRGRWSSYETSITALKYYPPGIYDLSVTRTDSDGTPNAQGTHAKVSYSTYITPLNNRNDATYSLSYAPTNGGSPIAIPETSTSYSLANSKVVPNVSGENSYVFTLKVSDYFTSTTYTADLSTDFYALTWLTDGRKGVGIGKVAEREGIDFGETPMVNGKHMTYIDKSQGLEDNGSDSWKYIKDSLGHITAWHYQKYTVAPGKWTRWGSVYYAEIPAVTYPTGLFTVNSVSLTPFQQRSLSINGGSAWGVAASNNITGTGTYYLFRPSVLNESITIGITTLAWL